MPHRSGLSGDRGEGVAVLAGFRTLSRAIEKCVISIDNFYAVDEYSRSLIAMRELNLRFLGFKFEVWHAALIGGWR